MDKSTGDTGDQQLIRDYEFHNAVELFLAGLEHSVKLFSLRNCARESVKDESMESDVNMGRGVWYSIQKDNKRVQRVTVAKTRDVVRMCKSYVPILASLVVLELILDDTNHDVVAHKTSGIHNLLGLNTESRLSCDLLSQQVTSRQMADTEFISDVGSLGTLACTVVSVHICSREAICS